MTQLNRLILRTGMVALALSGSMALGACSSSFGGGSAPPTVIVPPP